MRVQFSSPSLFILSLLLFFVISKGELKQAYAADALVDSMGINTHLTFGDTLYYENYSFVKSSLIDLGIRHIRDGGNTQDFRTKVLDLYENGIDTQLVIELRRNVYADPNLCKTIYPCIDIVSYINSFFGAIPSVEGPNENDLTQRTINITYLNYVGFPNATRQFAIDNYHALKAHATTKHIPVGSPTMGNARNSYMLAPFYDYMDFEVFHPYAGGRAPTLQGLLTWWKAYTDQMTGSNQTKPLQASECGYHTLVANSNGDQPGVSEFAQAKYMPRMWIVFFTSGVIRSYAYELLDNKNVNPLDSQEKYGIIRYNRTVKPVYYSIKNLISILGDRYTNFTPGSLDFTVSGASTIQTTLFQKANGDYYIAIWNEVSCFDINLNTNIVVPPIPANITINTAIKSYKVLQVSKSANVPITQGTDPFIQLSVPDELLFIVVTPAAQSSTGTVSAPPTILDCTDYKTVMNWTFSQIEGSFMVGRNELTWTAVGGWVSMLPDRVGVNGDGDVSITLSNAGCPSSCNNLPYGSGGWLSEESYRHGNFSFTLKMPSISGVYTAVHLYRGSPQDDIVLQFGARLNQTQVYIYYYANGAFFRVGNFDLGFDFSSDFRTYTISYGPTNLAIYAGDKLLTTVTSNSSNPIPLNPLSLRVWLMANPGNPSSFGTFNYTGPISVQLRRVAYIQNSNLPYPPSACIKGNADYGLVPTTPSTTTGGSADSTTSSVSTTTTSVSTSSTTDSPSNLPDSSAVKVYSTLALCTLLVSILFM